MVINFLHITILLRVLNELQITIQREYFSICGYCLSDVVESCFFSGSGKRTKVAEVEIQHDSH